MKKMKLLSFVLSGILAVSSMCGITASASDLYEIPENITSIKELEDFITSPVEISAKDYVRLSNQMTSEELEEFFKSNGVSDSDAELNVDSYYDGMKQVAESDCTFIIYPNGDESSKLYEIPEGITSIKELEDFITAPVEISAKDYVRLCNQMTSEELEEFFKLNGVSDSDAELNVDSYYDGMKEVAKSNCTFVIYPGGVETDYVPNDIPKTPLGVQQVERLTETSGTFEGGVTYFYNEETKGLIFDGNGELSSEDYTKAMNSFAIDFIFFGKNVTSECENGARFNAFYKTFVENWYNVVERPFIPVYTYEGSEFTRQFDECINEIGANASNFKYYIVEDDTDPYTFMNTLPELPTQIIDGGCFWAVDETHTSPTWYYEGTVYDGVSEGILLISSIHNDPYTLDDVLKVVGDYAVTEVHLGTRMSVLPAELQNCETIEEAEAELLRLINEAKEEEQSTEETTEVTVLTEVTEPTEAVEENTAETIVESVEILADEIAEDKTEITLGDVNGNGNVDVRDCSFIAREIAGGKAADLPDSADYNKDGVKNIRDAATLAKELA